MLYDRSGLTEQPTSPTPQRGVASPPTLGGQPGLGGFGGASPNEPTTADLSNQDLAAMTQTPDEQMYEEMAALLNDPNTPPEQRAAIEQELALAARRQLLGGQ